jgi:hypothetical protein
MDKKLLATMIAISMCSVMACNDDDDNSNDNSCTTPMTMECVDQNTRRICGSNKQWLNAPCTSNTVCSGGQCVPSGSTQTGCVAGQKQCVGNIAQVCNAQGQWSSQACTGTTPTCKDGACIAGQATACTDGQKQCAGTTVQTCVAGAWQNTTACSGATPFCQNGDCVAQSTPVEGACPTTKGAACDSSCMPVCSADNGHAYLCGNQGTVMEWNCAGNVCSVSASRDINCPKSQVVPDEDCDPATYIKSCYDDNTVLYCNKNSNKVASSTCNQCMINTETNYYCCNGDNEKCGGTPAPCTEGATQCAGTSVQTCTGGTWTVTITCSGDTPVCSNGACIAQGQVDPNACPQTPGAACESCNAVCSADNGHAYLCSKGTIAEWTCAGNICSVNDNNKITCPKSETTTTETDEACDNTYIKNCNAADSVKYCGKNGKVVIAECKQCLVNSETNYYCCNGNNDKCQGESQTCTEGETRCSGTNVEKCTNNIWIPVEACTGDKPVCNNGACVPGGQVDPNACSTEVGADCEKSCHSVCSADNSHAYLCIGNKIKEWTCENNICSVDDNNSVTCKKPQGTQCDSATFQKSCSNANTVQYCSNGEIVEKTCNQCMINTATNYYCCDGKNDKCQSTQACTEGAKQCSGNTIQVCSNGVWTNSMVCGESTPVCSNGQCVPQGTVVNCPTTAGATCDNCHAVCSNDGAHAYVCISGKISEWTCANNVCSVDDKNTVKCDKPQGDQCDSSTFPKVCTTANTVRYCNNGIIAEKACNQCLVNPDTNWYCCDGQNDKCQTSCTDGETRCSGDSYQICTNGEWLTAPCAGICSNGICVEDSCTNGQTRCSGNTYELCNNGQWIQADCYGYCSNDQCITDCTNGETRCSDNTIQVCTNGVWTNSTVCSGATPVCREGQCVSEGNNCPQTANADCDKDNPCQAVCANGGANAYVCNKKTGKIMEWSCANNICSVSSDNKVTCDKPQEPGEDCDPATYAKFCSSENTVKYCNTQTKKVVERACNQCIVNTATNYYCCDGNNDKCQGTQTCTNGDTQCSGNTVMQCVNNAWVVGTVCAGSTPVCSNGTCIPGGSSDECPQVANADCDKDNPCHAVCANGGANAYVCNAKTGKIMEWSCANNICSVAADNKVTCDKPGTEQECDSSYQKTCSDANTVKYCSNGKIVEKTCNQCMINTETNYYCCDGNNDKCLGGGSGPQVGDTCDPDSFEFTCNNSDILLQCNSQTNKVEAVSCSQYGYDACTSLYGQDYCYVSGDDLCEAEGDILTYNEAADACGDWDKYAVMWYSSCVKTGGHFYLYDEMASSICLEDEQGPFSMGCSSSSEYLFNDCASCTQVPEDEQNYSYAFCQK